jgi:phospholipid/cholesterol/gamma-HCH transport system ATP-binding protein
MTKKESEIILKNVHKSFGNKHVLRGINLDVAKGESLVVIGGSGSGKSVLIKNIIGLMEPTSGEIFIQGEDVSKLSSHQRGEYMSNFGMLFQGGALFDSLTVWQNIAFALLQSGKIEKKNAEEFSITKLAAVGLQSDVAHLYPSELSGGMQKRVSLARAIADDPKIIFFDEPTTGLDPIMGDVINDLIIKCSEEIGATTITITHDMHSAERIADNVAMIHEGKIIWHGKKDDLYESGNAYVDQFIHGSASGPIKMKVRDY